MRPLLWSILGRHLFRLTIQNQYGLRRRILRAFGANIGATTRFRQSVRIDKPWLLTAGDLTIFGDHAHLMGDAPITVGKRCVVSQYVLLASTARDPSAPGHPPRSAPITMEDDTWVAADSLVLPGAHVREGTVVGARSLIEGELPPWKICTGEPAQPRRERAFRTDLEPAAKPA